MTIGFTGSPLLRLDRERPDDAAFARHLADPQARLLQLDGLDPVLDDEAGALVWGPITDRDPDAELALLGLLDGRPAFVALTARRRAASRCTCCWGCWPSLPGPDAATLGRRAQPGRLARRPPLLRPLRREPPTVARGLGPALPAVRRRALPAHRPGRHHARRARGPRARGPPAAFPAGRYSALAGFVEVGESVEEAVARELFEEAGVRATRVRYVASQPWPLPFSQLMLACIVEVESAELTIDRDELDDAIWVDRDGVRAALAGWRPGRARSSRRRPTRSPTSCYCTGRTVRGDSAVIDPDKGGVRNKGSNRSWPGGRWHIDRSIAEQLLHVLFGEAQDEVLRPVGAGDLSDRGPRAGDEADGDAHPTVRLAQQRAGLELRPEQRLRSGGRQAPGRARRRTRRGRGEQPD
jgi:NAD+ diphosphatase